MGLEMNNNLLAKLTEGRSGFSKSQRRIADFIIMHYDKAAFMTAYTLGQTVDVSESTVVRFATELGYDGYPHMQRVLREMVNTRLTSLQRIELTSERMKNRSILKSVMESDVDKIRRTLENVDDDSFNRAVELIMNARHIYILGLRSSSFLANFMGFYFKLMFENVTVVGGASNEGDIFENLFRAGEGDVVVGISFPRYSKRTLRGLRFAVDKKADVISVTDSPGSPIANVGDSTLFAPTEMASFVDSFVAPLSLINALIISVGMRKKDDISKTFEVLEGIWEEYETYEKFENT
jgi:DNA-binding MurR/RpiR family transcriptional regulator